VRSRARRDGAPRDLELAGRPAEYSGRLTRYNPVAEHEFRAGGPALSIVKILHRYVLKEHIGPLLFALSALTSLLLINYIGKHLGDLVGKGLPWTVIAEFLLLSVPFTIAMTLPMAVLVSTLYAFSRLAAENEITGMKASGVSLARLLVPVLGGGFVVALVMLGFNDQLLPRANHRLATLMADIGQKKPTFGLRANQMNEVVEGRFFLKTSRIDQGSGLMRSVEITDNSSPEMWRTIYADSGEVRFTRDLKDLVLTLYAGEIYEIGKIDRTEVRHMIFERHQSKVEGVGNQLKRTGESNYRSDREQTICELQDELEGAEVEYHRARLSQDRVQANQPVAANASPQPPAITFRRPWRLGHSYCAILTWAKERLAITEAEAAELAVTEQGQQQAAQAGRAAPGQVPPSQAPPAQVPPGQVPPGQVPPAQVPPVQPPLPGQPIQQPPPIQRQLPAPPPGGAMAPPETARGITPEPAATPQPGVAASAVPAAAVPAAAAPAADISKETELGGLESLMETHRQSMNKYDVEIHKKFALAAACIVFILIGAPVALRFPRGGVGLVLGVSLTVFGLYYAGLIGGEELGDKGYVSPSLAMWLPNIVLTLIGIFLLIRMGRETATSRGGDMRELIDSLKSWFAGGARRLGLPVDRRRGR
jgi:lipopolysaccharide export system permease protein